MPSTRTRLTVSYGLVLLGTMFVFALAVLAGRRTGARDELAGEAFRAADNVWFSIQSAPPSAGRLTYADSSNAKSPTTRPTKEMAAVLDPLPGYFMVLDQQGKLLYPSSLIRQLSGDDQTALLRGALQLTDETGAAIVGVRGDSVHLLEVARRDPIAGSNISRIIAALPTDVVELPPQLLLGTIVVLAPIIFIISMIVAYFVVGSAFQPVDHLINEVEAITDGR
ncbi:MAG TPA: hypothetical protein VII52_07810, partial [Gemmatimonadaceae bacterium]